MYWCKKIREIICRSHIEITFQPCGHFRCLHVLYSKYKYIYCRNWPRFCVRSPGWMRHHALVGSPIAPRAARSRATPRVHGGASNQCSWCKNVINFNSTMIISVMAIKPCNVWSRIIRSWIGITSFKSTPPSSESTSLCTRDDVTMVDECKQSTTTSSTEVKKDFQMNTFHAGLKAWMDLYHHCVCPGSYLKFAFSLSKQNMRIELGITHGDRHLSDLLNYPWVCAPTMHYFLSVTSQQSGSPIGGEWNSQTTHRSIVVE